MKKVEYCGIFNPNGRDIDYKVYPVLWLRILNVFVQIGCLTMFFVGFPFIFGEWSSGDGAPFPTPYSNSIYENWRLEMLLKQKNKKNITKKIPAHTKNAAVWCLHCGYERANRLGVVDCPDCGWSLIFAPRRPRR